MANDFTAFNPELWADGLLREMNKVTLALPVVANTDYEGTISAFGDTVHVQTVEKLTVQNYIPGTPINYEDVSPADETLVIDQKDYIAFKVDDVANAQSKHNIRAAYEERGGQAFAEYWDRYIFNHYTSVPAANRITNGGSAINITASTAGSSHVYDIVVEAGRLLDVQDAPQGARWLIVTPYMKSLFLKDTVYFVNGSTLGDTLLTTATVMGPDGVRVPMTASQAARQGFIGQVAGFDVYCSNNLRSDAGGYYCLYGQGRPVSFASQIPPGGFEAGRLETQFGWGIRALVLFGSKVFAEPGKRLGYVYVDNS